MLEHNFFDAEVLEQSVALAESLDKFHFYMQENNLDEAYAEIYNLSQYHQRPFIYKNIYWLEVKRKSLEGQVRAARKLVELDPSDDHKYLLAQSLSDANAEREALEIYHEIIDESSEPTWLLFTVFKAIGNIYLKMGDYEAAEEYFNRANTINSEDLNLVISYGYLYLQSGQLADSKEKFALALLQESTNMEARMGLALVHVTVGDYELGCANLAMILEKDPTNKMALHLHYKWSEKITKSETIRFIDAYLQKIPSDDGVQTLKISWYVRQQNYKKAQQLLPELKKHFKGNRRNIANLETYLQEMA